MQRLHCTKKWSFPLRISSVNVTKSAGNCRLGHIYWRNSEWKTSFFVQCNERETIILIWVWKGETFTRGTTQKMKFSIKDFFSKCEQIRSFLRIWSLLLKKSLMKIFIFCAVRVEFIWGPVLIRGNVVSVLIYLRDRLQISLLILREFKWIN